MDVAHLRRLARNHASLIVLAAVVAAGVALLTSWTTGSTTYQAKTSIMLHPFDTAEALSDAGNVRPIDFDRYVANELAVIESMPVAERAAAAGLHARDLLERVDASPVGESDVIAVRVTAGRPNSAVAAANDVADAYLSLRRDQAVEVTQRKIGELDAQLAALTEEMAHEERVIADERTSAADRGVAEMRQAVGRTLYTQSLEHHRRLRSELELKRGGAEIIERADEAEPVGALGTSAVVIGGAVLGVMLSVAGLAARERITRRLRRRVDIEALGLGVPVFAEIPLEPSVGCDHGVPTIERLPGSRFAGATRLVRRAINVTWEPKPPYVIVVTSPSHGDGRSTVAVNLAAAFARGDVPTTIVDGDLRRPGLGGELDAPRHSFGLARLIQGAHKRFTASKETDVENLRALDAGPCVAHPDEVLSSERTEAVFAALATDSDMVIVDSPPALDYPDAALLAFHADAVLMIVRAGATTEKALRLALSSVGAGTSRPVAIIVNATEEG